MQSWGIQLRFRTIFFHFTQKWGLDRTRGMQWKPSLQFYVEAVLRGCCYRIPHTWLVLWVCFCHSPKHCGWVEAVPINTSHQEELDLDSELQKIIDSLGTTAHHANVFAHFIWPQTWSCCLIFRHIFCCKIGHVCTQTQYAEVAFYLKSQKQARWLRLLQWQPSARSPHCVFFKKEKLLQSPNTTTLQYQS